MSPLDCLTRRRRHEHGFSLIELMVVLLIIAILLGVAIPTYLAARNRAENRAAQEILTHAVEAVMTAETSSNGLTGTGKTALESTLGPGVTLVWMDPVSAAGQVSFYNFGGPSPVIKVASWSPAGVCWMAIASRDSVYFLPSSVHDQPGIFYGAVKSPQASGCSQYYAVPTSGWRSSWSSASAHL